MSEAAPACPVALPDSSQSGILTAGGAIKLSQRVSAALVRQTRFGAPYFKMSTFGEVNHSLFGSKILLETMWKSKYQIID